MKIQLIAKTKKGITLVAEYESEGKIIPTENHLIYTELDKSVKEMYKIMNKEELKFNDYTIDIATELEVNLIEIPDNLNPFKSIQ